MKPTKLSNLGGLYLLALVASPAREVLHALALEIKVREQDNLFLLELAQLLWYHHVGVSVVFSKLNNKYVVPEPVGHCGLQAGAGEGLPVLLLPLHHGLVGERDAPEQAQVLPVLLVGLQLAGELFLIVFDQLLLDHRDHSRYLVVLVSAQLGVNFLVGAVPGVEIDETLEGSVGIILELVFGPIAFADVGHFLDHVGHDVGDGGFVGVEGRVERVKVLFVFLVVGGSKLLDFDDFGFGAVCILRLIRLLQHHAPFAQGH